jgi:DNA-binding MarR family transcriptional regulator
MNKKVQTNPAGEAWALLLSVQARLTERIEAELAGAGLPPLSWYDMLWELEKAEDGRLRMHELAQRTVLSRSNLTRLADRLEQAGLITREPSPDDRRGYFCALTRAGRDMRRKMWPLYAEQIAALFAQHLSVREAETMVAALGKVLGAARRGAAGSAQPGQGA